MAEALAVYREMGWDELRKLVEKNFTETRSLTVEEDGGNEKMYQIQISAYWDDKPSNNIRIVAAIDDGGWRSFYPLTQCFIKNPSGHFIDE